MKMKNVAIIAGVATAVFFGPEVVGHVGSYFFNEFLSIDLSASDITFWTSVGVILYLIFKGVPFISKMEENGEIQLPKKEFKFEKNITIGTKGLK